MQKRQLESLVYEGMTAGGAGISTSFRLRLGTIASCRADAWPSRRARRPRMLRASAPAPSKGLRRMRDPEMIVRPGLDDREGRHARRRRLPFVIRRRDAPCDPEAPVEVVRPVRARGRRHDDRAETRDAGPPPRSPDPSDSIPLTGFLAHSTILPDACSGSVSLHRPCQRDRVQAVIGSLARREGKGPAGAHRLGTQRRRGRKPLVARCRVCCARRPIDFRS